MHFINVQHTIIRVKYSTNIFSSFVFYLFLIFSTHLKINCWVKSDIKFQTISISLSCFPFPSVVNELWNWFDSRALSHEHETWLQLVCLQSGLQSQSQRITDLTHGRKSFTRTAISNRDSQLQFQMCPYQHGEPSTKLYECTWSYVPYNQ